MPRRSFARCPAIGLCGLASLAIAGCGSSTVGGLADAAPDDPDAPDEVVDPACETTALDATFTSHLRITTDDACEVFVNGTSVGSTTSWPSPVTIDVTLNLHPSRANVVAIRGTNQFSQTGLDRGIVGELAYEVDSVPTPLVVTDAGWRTSTTEEDGWELLGFDDSAWPAATEVASHGDAPWGSVLTTTGAKWIWSAPIPADVADKPMVEIAYARREFYFGLDGASIDDQPSCP